MKTPSCASNVVKLWEARKQGKIARWENGNIKLEEYSRSEQQNGEVYHSLQNNSRRPIQLARRWSLLMSPVTLSIKTLAVTPFEKILNHPHSRKAGENNPRYTLEVIYRPRQGLPIATFHHVLVKKPGTTSLKRWFVHRHGTIKSMPESTNRG